MLTMYPKAGMTCQTQSKIEVLQLFLTGVCMLVSQIQQQAKYDFLSGVEQAVFFPCDRIIFYATMCENIQIIC